MPHEESISAFAAFGQQLKKKPKNTQKHGKSVLAKSKNRKSHMKKQIRVVKKKNILSDMVQTTGKNARKKQKRSERTAALDVTGVSNFPVRKFEADNKKRPAFIEEGLAEPPVKKEKLQTPSRQKLEITQRAKEETSYAIPNGDANSVAPMKEHSFMTGRSTNAASDRPQSIAQVKKETEQIQTVPSVKSQSNPSTKKKNKRKNKETSRNEANILDSIKKTSKFEGKIQAQNKHSQPEKVVESKACDPPTNDSVEDGREVFRWLVSPIDTDDFLERFWEKKPCLIQRDDASYFSKLISCSAIDQMFLENHVEFTKNIDITSYVDGVRETLNPEGRALPSVVWGHYEDGCSIRLLNPQTFIQPIYIMNATLQEFFHCMVGTNVYLTPPNSQGFAPHYDDIEAFVIQIEGQKRWKLYNPRNKKETLPRISSKNFAQDEIGEPILDKVLKPGDVLYFPRGTIHQACTQPGYHSLHITVSMYQKHSYADLFEILIPRMLSRAIEAEVDLRRGVPLSIWKNLGKVCSDSENEDERDEREDIMETCEKLMQKILRHADLDEAVDLMAKRFQHDALPPALTPAEQIRTIFGAKTAIDESGKVHYSCTITLDTHVRLIRANVLRVVEEENTTRVYYYVDNSKEYHEYEPNFIEIEAESADVVRQLVSCYPEYICTSELDAESDDIKLTIVQGLFERGLLMVDDPITT